MGNVTAKTSGEIASFMTPAETNITSLKVHFSPKQLGEGDPSPENVREIVGWNGVEINGCEENLVQFFRKTHTATTLENGFANWSSPWEIPNRERQYTYSVYIDNTNSSERACCKIWFRNQDNTTWVDGTASEGNSIPAGSCGWSTRTIIAKSNTYYFCFGFKINKGCTVSNPIVYETSKKIDISYQWKLPDEYQEVEYIESTGTQYIKTNYTPQNFDSIKCLFSMSEFYTSGSTYWTLFSAGTGTYQLIVLLAKSGVSGAYYKYFASGTASKFNFNPNIDTKYEMNVDSNGIISCNDYTAQSNYQNAVDTPLYLMMRANGESPFKGKIYKFSIINNGINMINLVPCYHKSDGEIGMYDTISQTFYTNQGTGEFLKGEDVNKTFYGGYVDLISGELVEEWSNPITISSPYLYSNQLCFPFEYDNAIQSSNPSLYNYVFDTFKESKFSNSGFVINAKNNFIYTTNSFLINNNLEPAYIESDNVKILNPWWENWYNSLTTPPKLIITMQTPITHQLTPTQLSSFIGQNNFWSNADYVEIEYELKETEDIQKTRKKIILNQPQLKSISDKIVSFNTDMVAPLKNCKIYFKPIQLGTGDPSPTNVRNINGWTGLDSYVNEDKISIDWTSDAGTVYGGYLDLAKKEVVVEWEMAQGRWGDIRSETTSDTGLYYCRFKFQNNILKTTLTNLYGTNTLCNVTNKISYESSDVNYNHYYLLGGSYNSALFYYDNTLDDNVIVQIVAKLVDPIHYPLSSLVSQQLLTLKSTNHIWSETNGQQIDVKYWTHKNLTPIPLTNYLENQTWTDSAYISSSGKKTTNTVSASHFLTNQILLEAGTYVLSGFSYYVGTDNTNYRIHAYDSTGKWLRQITFQQIGNLSPVDISFTLDTDTYINVSIAMDFDGVLAKIN